MHDVESPQSNLAQSYLARVIARRGKLDFLDGFDPTTIALAVVHPHNPFVAPGALAAPSPGNSAWRAAAPA